MKKVFQLEGGVYQILSKMADLLLINLLVILFSIPIITMGSAISAAFHLLMDTEEGAGAKIVSTFYHYFKQHFKSSTLLFLRSLAIFGVIVLLVRATLQTPFQFLSLLLAAFMLILMMNLLTTVAYKQLTLKETVITAISVSMKYTGLFCLSLTSLLLSLLVPIFLPKLMFLWFFFSFSLPLFIQTKIYLACMARFNTQYFPKGEE